MTVGAGAGAITTLFYGIRRQLVTEEVASDTRYDAEEKRVTELYVKGVDQLASDNTTSRLGGLFALERLASDAPKLRGTVVDLMCSELQRHSDESNHDFRAALHSILSNHLAYESKFNFHREYWPEVDIIDLSGVEFADRAFESWRLDTAHFACAKFRSGAWFENCQIRGANFSRIEVDGFANFDGAILAKSVFRGAEFKGTASFRGTCFVLDVSFQGATFAKLPKLDGAVVHSGARMVVLPNGWKLGDNVDRHDLDYLSKGPWRPVIRDDGTSE